MLGLMFNRMSVPAYDFPIPFISERILFILTDLEKNERRVSVIKSWDKVADFPKENPVYSSS